MGWSHIYTASRNNKLSTEFFGWLWNKEKESGTNKPVTNNNEIKTIKSSHSEYLRKYISRVENLKSDTIKSDNFVYFGFIHRSSSPGKVYPLVSLIDSYNKLIRICIENYNKVKNTSANLDNVKLKSLVPVMDHNYGNSNFSIVYGDVYEYPMLFSGDAIAVSGKKYFTLYTEDDKEGILDTDLYTEPDEYKVDKNKVLAGLKETQKLIAEIEKFKFNTYVENFKLSPDTDLEDEADINEVNNYRAKIQLFLLVTIDNILEIATFCPFEDD